MSVALSVGSTASRTAVPACSFIIIIVNIPISHMYLVLPFTACSPLPTRYLLLPPDGPSSPPHVTPDWPARLCFLFFSFLFFLPVCYSVLLYGYLDGYLENGYFPCTGITPYSLLLLLLLLLLITPAGNPIKNIFPLQLFSTIFFFFLFFLFYNQISLVKSFGQICRSSISII